MKTAKIFQNGQSQAVRLPKEFRFNGTEVFVKKIGNAIMLLPKDNWWSPMDRNIGKFTDDFMAERDQGVVEAREELFD
ncbi:MAG: AbrB/MazE/SpoVT family DNA-binding domain-containing protein [Erysipelotrichia bacterium]|nr:AbrB/MazE/SpoVT family DNA-binding domain-containing protein [Erysipelotrichia bacterium]